MSAPLSLYQTLLQRISTAVPATVRRSAVTCLALLVTGILAAKSTVVAHLAAELIPSCQVVEKPPCAVVVVLGGLVLQLEC